MRRTTWTHSLRTAMDQASRRDACKWSGSVVTTVGLAMTAGWIGLVSGQPDSSHRHLIDVWLITGVLVFVAGAFIMSLGWRDPPWSRWNAKQTATPDPVPSTNVGSAHAIIARPLTFEESRADTRDTVLISLEHLRSEGQRLLSRIKADPNEELQFWDEITQWRRSLRTAFGHYRQMEANALDVSMKPREVYGHPVMQRLPRDELRLMVEILRRLDLLIAQVRNEADG